MDDVCGDVSRYVDGSVEASGGRDADGGCKIVEDGGGGGVEEGGGLVVVVEDGDVVEDGVEVVRYISVDVGGGCVPVDDDGGGRDVG